MTTPARIRLASLRADAFGALAALAMLGACSPGEKAAGPAAEGTEEPDCLILVWQQQPERNEDFDRAHDRADGGAISCATGTSASQFEAALAAIRDAARAGDKRRLLDELGVPLLYIDASGNRREVRRDELADALFDEVFDTQTIAILSRVDLDDLTVVAGQGAFVELGSVWLVVDRKGGRPRIATVNRQALGEAAEAAAKAADEGRTDPAPMRNRND